MVLAFGIFIKFNKTFRRPKENCVLCNSRLLKDSFTFLVFDTQINVVVKKKIFEAKLDKSTRIISSGDKIMTIVNKYIVLLYITEIDKKSKSKNIILIFTTLVCHSSNII